MTQSPPPADEDDDAAIRLIDGLVEDAAREAAADPGPPSAAARELSRMARARCAARTVGGGGEVQALGSMDGELDTGRILAMDRAQLVATVVSLREVRGEPSVDLDPDVTDDQLRGAVRLLRPRSRP